MGITEANINKIKQLCEMHKVKSLYLFGSVLNDKFTAKSDVDFLVSFKNIELAKYFSNYISLKEKLKQLLKREVDLVEEQTLRNPILISAINSTKELIYG